jgi:hypothetical protein
MTAPPCKMLDGCRDDNACQPQGPTSTQGVCVPAAQCKHGTVPTPGGGLACARPFELQHQHRLPAAQACEQKRERA